jgi:transposase InsO family protein
MTVTRVMTDTGSCDRAKLFAAACKDFGLKHIRTKPHTPNTGGKVEPSRRPRTGGGSPLDVQTALRERSCADDTSDQRKSHLPEWTRLCNWHRSDGSLNARSAISRRDQTRDNLSRCRR